MSLIRLLPGLSITLLTGTLVAQSFDPPVAVDKNPASNIVEVDLTAAPTTWSFVPGKTTQVWAYNGSIPGPTIRTNVGDTLIVHLTNNLPEDTTLHFEGIEVPADQDGTVNTETKVPPGGTRTYQFQILRDGQSVYRSGLRAYDQVERGLYGCVIATDAQKEAANNLQQLEEHLVVFDDVLLDDTTYQILPAFPYTDPLKNADYQVNGRIGNHLLVNGREATSVTLQVPNGKPQRWRCVNVANSTFCRLDLDDSVKGLNNASIWAIGNDFGFVENPYKRLPVTSTRVGGDHPAQAQLSQMGEGILLLPGERLDVVFTPIGTDGQVFTVVQKDWARGRLIPFYGPGSQVFLGNDPLDGAYNPQDYFKLKVMGPNPGTGEYTPPATLNTYPPAPPMSAIKGELKLYFGHSQPDLQGNITSFAQGEEVLPGIIKPLPSSVITSDEAYDVAPGDYWIWQVINTSHADQVFHVDGFFFELLNYRFEDDTNPELTFGFVPRARRQIHDSFRLPPRLGAEGVSRCIARFLVHYDDTGRTGRIIAEGGLPTRNRAGTWIPGGWQVRCQVAERAATGMQTFLEVRDPGDPFQLYGRHLAGTNGNPYMTATGTFTPGSFVNIDVQNALPNNPIGILFGSASGSLPFAGGALVPSGTLLLLPSVTDAQGQITWSFNSWNTLPPGTSIYMQAAFPDNGAVQGWALTNALSLTRP